jgi:DNA-directed RNA polymerase subunit RPC12/RpoP
MGFSVVCHECGKVLYDGRDMIQLYKLRREIDNKCPNCKRRLALEPIKIEYSVTG